MNKARALYKAFSSNLEMPKPNGEKKVKLYNRFGMIAFIGIMVPVSVIVGYVTYVLTDLLYLLDGNSYGLLSELDLISAFAMIFGMPLMFSVPLSIRIPVAAPPCAPSCCAYSIVRRIYQFAPSASDLLLDLSAASDARAQEDQQGGYLLSFVARAVCRIYSDVPLVFQRVRKDQHGKLPGFARDRQ